MKMRTLEKANLGGPLFVPLSRYAKETGMKNGLVVYLVRIGKIRCARIGKTSLRIPVNGLTVDQAIRELEKRGRMLTGPEVGILLSVSPRTIFRWTEEGILQGIEATVVVRGSHWIHCRYAYSVRDVAACIIPVPVEEKKNENDQRLGKAKGGRA